ncbi:hypothetical protein [Alkalicoccus luteus]|uniref:Uncharacterized protein n=1 Tax=Alkalicoccus luteus TaxID=1237094 RepID=A0A969TUE7_9BACI|nr:hypothetical protein [Alkalicoccus luteus]NJP38633.1 hypothetical protein [Alkalicoccus luteus]
MHHARFVDSVLTTDHAVIQDASEQLCRFSSQNRSASDSGCQLVMDLACYYNIKTGSPDTYKQLSEVAALLLQKACGSYSRTHGVSLKIGFSDVITDLIDATFQQLHTQWFTLSADEQTTAAKLLQYVIHSLSTKQRVQLQQLTQLTSFSRSSILLYVTTRGVNPLFQRIRETSCPNEALLASGTFIDLLEHTTYSNLQTGSSKAYRDTAVLLSIVKLSCSGDRPADRNELEHMIQAWSMKKAAHAAVPSAEAYQKTKAQLDHVKRLLHKLQREQKETERLIRFEENRLKRSVRTKTVRQLWHFPQLSAELEEIEDVQEAIDAILNSSGKKLPHFLRMIYSLPTLWVHQQRIHRLYTKIGRECVEQKLPVTPASSAKLASLTHTKLLSERMVQEYTEQLNTLRISFNKMEKQVTTKQRSTKRFPSYIFHRFYSKEV